MRAGGPGRDRRRSGVEEAISVARPARGKRRAREGSRTVPVNRKRSTSSVRGSAVLSLLCSIQTALILIRRPIRPRCLPSPGESQGAIFPAEIAWTPKFNGLAGSYQLGGWWSSDAAPNVATSIDGKPILVSGLPGVPGHGRYGFSTVLQQQLARAPDNPDQKNNGLNLFLLASHADRRTSTTDDQIFGGIVQYGFGPWRPRDGYGIALGTTHVNPNIANNRGPRAASEARRARSRLPPLSFSSSHSHSRLARSHGQSSTRSIQTRFVDGPWRWRPRSTGARHSSSARFSCRWCTRSDRRTRSGSSPRSA
jgi:hypothetical protein